MAGACRPCGRLGLAADGRTEQRASIPRIGPALLLLGLGLSLQCHPCGARGDWGRHLLHVLGDFLGPSDPSSPDQLAVSEHGASGSSSSGAGGSSASGGDWWGQHRWRDAVRGRQHQHQQRRLHNAEGGADANAQCRPPKVDMMQDRYKCVEWKKVCVDQNVIVYYDPEVHPKHSLEDVPLLNVSDIMYNLPSKYGIGDRYRKGSALRFPQLYIRPANDMEEEPELQEPVFSKCTLPVLLYAHYPFNAAETYRYIFEKLVRLQELGFFDERITMVAGVPPGTRVPSYTKFWFGSLTDRAVVSLSQLSARLPPSSPSNATWEGTHVRCFERMVGCKIKYDRFGLKFWDAGQHVVRHYMPQMLANAPDYAARLLEARKAQIPDDPTVFKMVFISRNPHQSAVGRTILNEAELIQQCNDAGPDDLPPPAWGVPYTRFYCFAHTFGEDQLMDVWIARQVDMIVGMHGAGLTNGMYMKPGGSVVEVRPLGFSGRESWANRYARFKASSPAEKPWRVFWYGIDTFNESNSEPGMFESEHQPHYSQYRVIKARDRHVRIPWPCLRHQLLNAAAVARTHDRYMHLRLGGSFYITDSMEQAEPPKQDPLVSAALQRNFTSAEQERSDAVKLPMDAAALKLAATPDAAQGR